MSTPPDYIEAAAIWNRDERIAFFVCDECWAVVFYEVRKAHTAWHARILPA